MLSISLIFQVPLIPLLGIPIFVLGFARPHRVWPSVGESFASQDDSNLYLHMTSQALKILPRYFQGYALGVDIFPGDIFLLRHDPFIMWVEIIEKGLGYCILVVKGMELQTTSCHAVEATNLDGVIEETFNMPEKCVCINKNLFHTFDVRILCFV